MKLTYKAIARSAGYIVRWSGKMYHWVDITGFRLAFMEP